MRRLFILMILVTMALFVAAQHVSAEDIKIQLAWQPNTEVDMKQYLVYTRLDGQAYDYTSPAQVVPCSVTDGKCLTALLDGSMCTTYITLSFPDGQKTKHLIVLQAEDTSGNKSGDSNEVFYEKDFTPLPINITDLAGTYDPSTKTITLTWSQTAPGQVAHWGVYISTQSGTGYVPHENIDWDGTSTTITSAKPVDAPEGAVTNYYFVIVGFTSNWERFTPNSNEAVVTVDKLPPAPPTITLEIPVQ